MVTRPNKYRTPPPTAPVAMTSSAHQPCAVGGPGLAGELQHPCLCWALVHGNGWSRSSEAPAVVISWVGRGPSQSKREEWRGEKRRGKGVEEEARGGGRQKKDGRAEEEERREERGEGQRRES